MNIEIIQNGLESAYHLLNDEIQSVDSVILKEEYQSVIDKLELAMQELKSDY